MKILADENIPLVDYFFGKSGEIILKPGRIIQNQDLQDIDILLVRSVTEVNQKLLQNTPVRFVGSTTIGMDHLDIDWLKRASIPWAIAKGCNSTAVVEYVMSVIAALQTKGFLLEKKVRAGVIGVGDIGGKVVEKLKNIGFDVIQHDPLRAEKESDFISTSLDKFSELDFITIHTPLTTQENYSTYHMIEKNFLQQQKKGCFLLNTSRGAVINFKDLKQYGNDLIWCLDVWENEPDIDLDILTSALIATPHIAGYSVQSKYRGIEMIYQAALNQKIILDEHLAPIIFPTKDLVFDHPPTTWQEVALKIYNPLQTSDNMKQKLLHHEETFDQLRRNFEDRYEFEFCGYPHIKLQKKYLFSLLPERFLRGEKGGDEGF